jgi:hypothetical protein
LSAVFFAALCFSGTSIVANASESSSSSQTEEMKDICRKLESLLHDFYPKAKITTEANSLHFEYKLKSEIGYYSNRPVMAPQDGGILGDLEERPGQYQGQDKDRLPSELPDGFHTTLTMAPYSGASKTCLFTTLMFPSDMSEEFKAHFKEIIDGFVSSRTTADASVAPATASVAVADAAPAASTQAVAIPQSINSIPATATDAAAAASRTANVHATPTAAPAASPAATAPEATKPAAAAAASQSPAAKTTEATVPPAAKKSLTAGGATSSSRGLHLFDANSNPIGGTKVGGPTLAPAPKSGAMVKFPKYGYLPALPIKVQIISSQRLPNGLVNICYYTPDPPKKAESIWRQQIDKTPWTVAPDQVAGQLRMYIKFNVANATPNQLLHQGNTPFGFGQTLDMSRFNQPGSGGYDVAAAIVFTPSKTGTIVNIVYGERL